MAEWARTWPILACVRGNRDQTTMEELRRVHDEASQVSLKFTLPELEAALKLG